MLDILAEFLKKNEKNTGECLGMHFLKEENE